MKKIYLILSIACAFILGSCSSDDNQLIQENEILQKGEKYIIDVNMPVKEGTRVSTDELTNMKWENGDKLIAVGYDADGVTALGSSEFTMISDVNGSTASFEGYSVSKAVFHKFVYIGKNCTLQAEYLKEHFNCDYNNQIQEGVNSTAHIKDCLHLESSNVKLTKDLGKVTLHLKSSVLRVNINSLPSAIKDATQFQIGSYIDYYGASYLGKLTYNGSITEGSNNYLYIAFDPQRVLKAYSNIGFEITANDLTARATLTAQKTKHYEPGKIYTIRLNFKEPGAWLWEEPKKEAKILYAPGFYENDGWIEETNYDINLWAFGNGQAIFNQDGYNIWGGSIVDTRLISPNINLVANNYVQFTYYIAGFSDLSIMQSKTKLYIREANGGEWTPIPDFTGPYDGYLEKTWIDTGLMAIPSQFNNKTVQISFTYFSQPYEIGWNTYDGSYAALSNFSVISQ